MTSNPAVRGDGWAGLAAVAAVGGGIGAGLRHVTGLAASGDGDLVITLAVNVVGCLLLGLLPLIDRVGRSEAWRVAVGPGLLGGFTTLSAVNEQTRALLGDGRTGWAGAYLFGTLVVCVAAASVASVVVGRSAARRTGR